MEDEEGPYGATPKEETTCGNNITSALASVNGHILAPWKHASQFPCGCLGVLVNGVFMCLYEQLCLVDCVRRVT